MSLPIVHIWTDGACSGNPGPGGWAAYLMFGSHYKEIYGGSSFTTSNQMELTAILEALKLLNKPCDVVLHTDSQNCIGWLHNGWKLNNTSIKFICDQITSVITSGSHLVRYEKVPGHAKVEHNERVDHLATSAIPS